ncbi:hypothetical protein ACLB2K_041211 [Fragaria x ananassa]
MQIIPSSLFFCKIILVVFKFFIITSGLMYPLYQVPFVVNSGDFLQLISNDKFKSVEHRVLANCRGPRISVAGFFSTGLLPLTKLYGSIKEFIRRQSSKVQGDHSKGL